MAAQSLVAANVDFTGLLEYRPTQTGTITLDVIAYRDAIASDPASVTISIVASAAQLSNPSSLDPTLQVAAGPICTEQVTVSGLALHTGPGTSFHLITTLTSGETVSVTGRTAELEMVRGAPSKWREWVGQRDLRESQRRLFSGSHHDGHHRAAVICTLRIWRVLIPGVRPRRGLNEFQFIGGEVGQ